MANLFKVVYHITPHNKSKIIVKIGTNRHKFIRRSIYSAVFGQHCKKPHRFKTVEL